jgi:ADP-heptose:LPS heptosyltransferase
VEDYIFISKNAAWAETLNLFKIIKNKKFDLAMVLEDNPTPRFAFLCWLARIPYRMGDRARLLYGWTYNHGVWLNSADPKLHQIELFGKLLAPLGITQINFPLNIPVAPASQKEIDQLLQLLCPNAPVKIGLHIGTGGGDRALPAETYAKIADQLARKHYQVILIGGKNEVSVAEQIKASAHPSLIDLTNQLSLAELFALLNRLNLFIGVNSGPLHAAAALNLPTVAIYVAKDVRMERWLPWMSRNLIVKSRYQCPLRCAHRKCTLNYCTAAVQPEEIMASAKTLLQGGGNHSLEETKKQADALCQSSS